MSTESLDLWLVLREGIASREVAYIATTEADALHFCEQWEPDSDGWHDWAIRRVAAGQHIDVQRDSWKGHQLTRPRRNPAPPVHPGRAWQGLTRKCPPDVEHPLCLPLTALAEVAPNAADVKEIE